jgi:GT2 family glycosyltransferase
VTTETRPLAHAEADRVCHWRAAPPASVVLATCDRRGPAARAIRSILANDGDFELVIVDQSGDDTSDPSFNCLLANPAVRYYRRERRGLSAARNAGVRLSRGELIVMTDDDCEVPANWLRALLDVFQSDRRTALAFGNVVPGRFDATRGFIPSYVRTRPFRGCSVDRKNDIEGIGACMAFRRELWERLGGFDEMLGASQRFPAAEDGDFALRALRRGFHVCETPEVEVTHHGFRTWDEGKKLSRGYWYGTGAMFAKHLKLAPASTARLLAGLGWRFLVGRSSLPAQSLGTVSTRVKLAAFTRGFITGLGAPVNHDSECFESRKNLPSRARSTVT